MQKPTEKGLESVRHRAKRQQQIRLSKLQKEDREGRASLQKIRTLKSLEGEVREQLEFPKEDVSIFGRFWDWFQRTIGNR